MNARAACVVLVKRAVVGVSMFVPLTMPTVVSGEWFADLYAGASMSQDADVSVEEFAPLFTPASAHRTVAFDPSITYGGRLGYWFKWVPWVGIAVDASSFRAEGKGVDIDLIPVSALFMLRWPLLTSAGTPYGRLQPYVGIGGSTFIVPSLDVDFRPAVAQKISTDSAEFGLDTRAGLAWQFHKRFALFAEYRYTHVRIEIDEKGCAAPPCTTSILPPGPQGFDNSRRVEATLDTHHLLVGVSLRF
jgi:hypothetical protein